MPERRQDTTLRTPAPGEPDPREVLEGGLGECFDESPRITAVDSEPLDTFSSHPIHRLRVTLEGGGRLPIIFKRLRPGPEKDVAHEVLLYRRLLAGRRFGAPMLYASLCDRARGIYWLFLEDVGGWKLEYCETEDWPVAFRWLAAMHAEYHGREEELRALGCLGEHGPEFYETLAATARESLAELGEPRALARFDGLMERFGLLAAYLLGQPRTLVHGDASCHNIMVGPGLYLRPLDWEWAAVGLGAWDLAKLLSGWGEEKPRLLAAYRDEFELRTQTPLDRGELGRTLAGCEILMVLWYLRWWIRPCKDPLFVDGMLDKIEAAWERLESGDDG